MFECGQPLHAYDLDRLDEHRLVVRRAQKGETLTAINNRVYELSPEMLVIADAVRPVGLGGVMGGAETEIGPGTTHVLIEAAQFDPVSVRRTSRALGLFSPSSFRFERPLDPEMTEWASRRCCELILKVAGGTLHPGRDRRRQAKARESGDWAASGSNQARPGNRSRPRGSCADLESPGARRRVVTRLVAHLSHPILAERPRARDRLDRGGCSGPRLSSYSRKRAGGGFERAAGCPRAGRGGRSPGLDRRRL